MSSIRDWFSMSKAEQNTLTLETGSPWGGKFLFRVKKEGKMTVRLDNNNGMLPIIRRIPSGISKFSYPAEFFAGTASEAIDMITEDYIEEVENDDDNGEAVCAWELRVSPLLQYRDNGQWIDAQPADSVTP